MGQLAKVALQLLHQAQVQAEMAAPLQQGFGTRKYCRALIEDGEVSIAGVVHDKYKETLETDGLVLTVFEEEWEVREHVYIALYKPANFECSRKPSHHPGVLTLLPGYDPTYTDPRGRRFFASANYAFK